MIQVNVWGWGHFSMVKKSTGTVDSDRETQVVSQRLGFNSHPGGSSSMGYCKPFRISAVMNASGFDPDWHSRPPGPDQSLGQGLSGILGSPHSRQYRAQHSGRRSPLASWRG